MTVSFFRFTKLNWTIMTNDPNISESKKKKKETLQMRLKLPS